MSPQEWGILLLIVIIASAGAGWWLGMIADAMGSDDRDDSRPPELWDGYERRKVKPYVKR